MPIGPLLDRSVKHHGGFDDTPNLVCGMTLATTEKAMGQMTRGKPSLKSLRGFLTAHPTECFKRRGIIFQCRRDRGQPRLQSHQEAFHHRSG